VNHMSAPRHPRPPFSPLVDGNMPVLNASNR
jgi:hypothetical protein